MKYQAGDLRKYRGLEMSEPARELLISSPRAFASLCNGVGSKVGFFKRLLWFFTPDTIWGLDITDCSDIHDVGYTVPAWYPSLSAARSAWIAENDRFLRNLRKRIAEAGGWLEGWRLNRSKLYHKAVSKEAAFASFLDGKTIG